MSGLSGGRRLLALLLLHSALTQVVTFVLRPTSAYRAIELDVPAAWLGALTASFAVVPLLLAVPSGQATDRFGERRVMLVGAVLMSASGAVFLLEGLGAAGLVAGSIVLGTGHLCSVVGQQAAVANTAGPGTFDTAFGYYTFAASLGQAIGPALITVVGGKGAIPDTRPIFAVATALGVVLLACTVFLHTPERERSAGPAERGGMGTLLRLPGLLRALVISCVVLAAVDITLVYLPALGADRGLAAGLVGILLTLRAAASMTSRFFLGRLARWAGRRRLMIGSVALSAAAMAAVAFPLPPVGTGVLVVLLGLGLGVGQPLTMSWLAEVAPAGLRGRAMSLRLTGNRLGQVLIPSTVGFLAAGLGSAGVLWATAGALALVGAAARRLEVDGSRYHPQSRPSEGGVMFSLMVQVQVDPERREEFLAAITANAEASVRDEPGCLRFDVSSLEGDDNRFVFYELYTDADAFAAHRTAPHFRTWRETADRTVVHQVNTPGTVLLSHTDEASA